MQRNLQLTFFVAVIIISGAVVVQLLRDSGDDPAFQRREPDPAITRFWVDEGWDLMNRWRDTAPAIVTDINDGSTCLPSADVAAARCPDLPDLYTSHQSELADLIEYTQQVGAPEDSLASEWRDQLVEGLVELRDQLGRFEVSARDDWNEATWQLVMREYRETDLLGESEVALARMLERVEPGSVVPPGANTPTGTGAESEAADAEADGAG